jgi:rhodanese-related sulfurtransferase
MDCDSKCAVSSPTIQHADYGHVDTKGLAMMISSGIPLVILDARSGKWDDGKRIGPAKALSYEATAEQAASVIPTKQSLIVVYCSNLQCPASGYLAKRLSELGYTNIMKYNEGIQEWINSGNGESRDLL